MRRIIERLLGPSEPRTAWHSPQNPLVTALFLSPHDIPTVLENLQWSGQALPPTEECPNAYTVNAVVEKRKTQFQFELSTNCEIRMWVPSNSSGPAEKALGIFLKALKDREALIQEEMRQLPQNYMILYVRKSWWVRWIEGTQPVPPLYIIDHGDTERLYHVLYEMVTRVPPPIRLGLQEEDFTELMIAELQRLKVEPPDPLEARYFNLCKKNETLLVEEWVGYADGTFGGAIAKGTYDFPPSSAVRSVITHMQNRIQNSSPPRRPSEDTILMPRLEEALQIEQEEVDQGRETLTIESPVNLEYCAELVDRVERFRIVLEGVSAKEIVRLFGEQRRTFIPTPYLQQPEAYRNKDVENILLLEERATADKYLVLGGALRDYGEILYIVDFFPPLDLQHLE